jgi:hypothetical protein
MRFGLMTRFIDHLYTQLVAANNYNSLTGLLVTKFNYKALVNPCSLTTTHAKSS